MGVLCCYFRPKMFSPGDHVRYHSRTLGAHVLATVVGPSPNGLQFCHIRYIRPGGVTPVDHESAQLSRLEAVVVESPKSVAAPKARAKAAPQPRAKPAAKRTGLALQAGAKAAAKAAPRAIASSSSANATHPVPVMQTDVQQFKVCYSRTQKFFTVPLDPQ